MTSLDLCPTCTTTNDVTAHKLAKRRLALLATGGVIGSLALINVVKHLVPSSAGVVLGVGSAAALLAGARASGLSWAQLGLSRRQLRSGAKWAVAAIGAVGTIYLAGVLVPSTRTAFLDARYQFAVIDALKAAFVVIPLSTVLLEEVAFRSVLWGMLHRHMSTTKVVLASSVLFGLWHVLPSLDFAAARGLADGSPDAGATTLVVLGTVVFTAVGGLVAGELRRRSDSVVASAGMHWATNALGVLFGHVAWRLVT